MISKEIEEVSEKKLIEKAHFFIHSKEGQRWMKENKKRLRKAYKNKEGIFSEEEDEMWKNIT